MRRIRLTILFLLPFLYLFVTTPRSSNSQSREQKQVDPATSIEFTVETRDKEPRFFEPLHLQVLLRNNSEATHSIDLGKLRLRPAGWWGSSGGGSGLVEDIGATTIFGNSSAAGCHIRNISKASTTSPSKTVAATRRTGSGMAQSREIKNPFSWLPTEKE